MVNSFYLNTLIFSVLGNKASKTAKIVLKLGQKSKEMKQTPEMDQIHCMTSIEWVTIVENHTTYKKLSWFGNSWMQRWLRPICGAVAL